MLVVSEMLIRTTLVYHGRLLLNFVFHLNHYFYVLINKLINTHKKLNASSIMWPSRNFIQFFSIYIHVIWVL